MFVFLTVLFGLTLSHEFFDIVDLETIARTSVPKLDLNNSYFPSLANYAVNATPASETKYPWIAKVVHSSTIDWPYMCTASCIRERVFITAARCISILKVKHTTVIYQNKYRLPVLVFITPSFPSKQSYDDIGIIVVKQTNEKIPWETIHLYNTLNRTDDRYEWFTKVPKEGYKAIGYSTLKELRRISSPLVHYNLTELEVKIGLDICGTMTPSINAFRVPCYHYCDVEQLRKKVAFCSNYHGVEGAAIIEINSNKLLAVVTWGNTPNSKSELPVGIAVVNSKNFFEDYKCALAIAGQKTEVHHEPLYWQKFCDKL